MADKIPQISKRDDLLFDVMDCFYKHGVDDVRERHGIR